MYTYFLDVLRTKKTGKPYMKITGVRKGDKEGTWERSTIIIHPDGAFNFAKAVRQMATRLYSSQSELR